MNVEGKVAIVTGGASGLGKATAQALISAGAKVAIWDMNADLGNQVAAELGENAYFTQLNVTDAEAVEKAVQEVVDRFGAIHILANIAGIARPRLVINKEGPTSLKDFEDVIDVDLIAPYNIIRLVAWAMSKNEPVTEDGERGVIINTSSIAADHGQKGQQSYSAAKGALNSMALPIARGLARNGIRCVGIMPGLFLTPIYSSQERIDAMIDYTVFPKRFGKPDEFASLALEIVRNSMLNGITIRLDGAVRF